MDNGAATKDCSYCDSADVTRSILAGSRESSHVGLYFRPGRFILHVEPLLADLCNTCKRVTLRVENTDRAWFTS